MSSKKNLGQQELELIVDSAKDLSEHAPSSAFPINPFTTGINFEEDRRILSVKDYSNFIFELELGLIFSQKGKKSQKETLSLSSKKKKLLGISAVTVESYKIPKEVDSYDKDGKAIEIDWSNNENWDEDYVGRRESFLFDVLKNMLVHKPISVIDTEDNTELERSYFLTTSLREIELECAKFGGKINRKNIKQSLYRLNKTNITFHGIDNSSEFSTLIDKIYYREGASSVDKRLVIVFRGVIAKAIEGKKQFVRFNLRKFNGENSTLLEEWFKKECYIYDNRFLGVGDTATFSFTTIIEDSGLLNFNEEKPSKLKTLRKKKMKTALDQICRVNASIKFQKFLDEWKVSLFKIIGLDELIEATVKNNNENLITPASVGEIKFSVEGIGSAINKKYPNLSDEKKKQIQARLDNLLKASIKYYSRIYFESYRFVKYEDDDYVELIGAKASLIDEIKKMRLAKKRFDELQP